MKAKLTITYGLDCTEEDREMYEEMLADGADSDLEECFEFRGSKGVGLEFENVP